VCRSKHVEPSINFGIINSIASCILLAFLLNVMCIVDIIKIVLCDFNIYITLNTSRIYFFRRIKERQNICLRSDVIFFILTARFVCGAVTSNGSQDINK
jgi:hypothetical protein